MSTIDTPARARVPLTWKQAAEDVFVATLGGEHAGYVVVEGVEDHVLHDRHSRRVGIYPTLADARAALASLPSERPRIGRASRRCLTAA